MSTAPDIFLSYNREDQARANVFADAFAAQGFSVWWDVGLRAGDAYDEVTENALRTAKAGMRRHLDQSDRVEKTPARHSTR